MVHKPRVEMIEETRKKLITAARRQFGTEGYAATVMDDLTAQAGLTRGALYHHFGDKRGLFLAVLQNLDQELDARLDMAEKEATDEWQAFKARCQGYLAMSLEPEVQRIMFRDAASVLDYSILKSNELACVQGITRRLTHLMEKGLIKQVSPQVLALFINGGLYECAMWIVHSDEPDITYKNVRVSFNQLMENLRNDI
ncbi:TetR/AcrR family transcriptional regulator [Morganella psychrotolerans]|uniref:TetR/AcrR family transcriptional regulator n=1 Tax=Morganella psychrotolerans TaxID=368603 RepID=UPI0039AF9052